MKRTAERIAYALSISILTHLLPSSSAVYPVVFEPEKISRTISLGSVRKRIKKSGRACGNLAGWAGLSKFLQVRR